MDSLKRLGQEEALLHVVVGGVGGVDVLHPREAPTHPAVLVNGLQGAEERGGGEEGGGIKTKNKRKNRRKGDEREGQRVGDILIGF